MIERQIDSPIPKPPGLVVKKDSNNRSTLSGANPGPESRTAMSTPSESVFAVLMSNSRGPSLIPLIASIALINQTVCERWMNDQADQPSSIQPRHCQSACHVGTSWQGR